MRRRIEKGSFVKVIDPSAKYTENIEIAKELGFDETKFGKGVLKENQTGTVIGIEGGYVLVDFGDNQYLMDIEGISLEKKPEDVHYLIRYMHNNSIEELSSMEEVEKRLNELVISGSLRLGQQVKIYTITSVKEVKMKMTVVLN